jgi:murein L,D-transpeptidase YafK
LFRKTVTLLLTVCSALALLGFPAKGFARPAEQVDRILIEKSKRTMLLMSGTQVLKAYKVALGGQPVGAKDRRGDHQTPEGTYTVDGKIPRSQFHKALHVSYPNSTDRVLRKLGVSPGGDVETHGIGEHWGGLGAKDRLSDRTDECINQ